MSGRTIVEWGKSADSPYLVRMRLGEGKPFTGWLDSALALAVSDDAMLQALNAFSRKALISVRNGLKQTPYSARAKAALADALSFEIRGSNLSVKVRHPAFRPLVLGQKKQQMLWLTKARSPIPIVTDRGELIFRSATPRSMSNGMWVHPGRRSTGIFEQAVKEAKAAARKELKGALVARLRKAFTR